MLIQTIISLTVIVALTLVMSFLLAKIISKINKRSEEYFEKKIVVYDGLIDEKQKCLDTIEQQIENATIKRDIVDSTKQIDEQDNNPNNVIVANEKMPEYKIEGFFKKAKAIEDKFKFNKETAIRDFIDGRNSDSEEEIEIELRALYDRLSNMNRYDYIVNNLDSDWDFVNNQMSDKLRSLMSTYALGNPNADINEILSYIKLEMDKADLGIVVETGDENDNFGYINSRIKTVYNPDIYMGIRIFYQDRMYDYSLGGEV